MGEAVNLLRAEFPELSEDKKIGECISTTIVGDKTYVVGGNGTNTVKIFNKSEARWVIPTTLGRKPNLNKGHSAVLVDKNRILILCVDPSHESCFWFLEVDTQFVREQKKRLGGEVVAWSKGVMGHSPMPVVISGPSGVGKGTLISKLMKEFPSMFGFSVSHTTRLPREREVDGIHYHFTGRDTMEKDIHEGKFLESAHVHGNLYGTSIDAVETVTDSGKRCILDIDIQGARSVKAGSIEAVLVFICPPSFEELEKRLRSRGTETEEQIQKRLANARAELEEGTTSGLFDYILINDDIESCYVKLKNILGIHESNSQSHCSYFKHLEFPTNGSISGTDQKVLICGTSEIGKTVRNLFVLDMASLKGGAPGRTRGLSLYDVKHGI